MWCPFWIHAALINSSLFLFPEIFLIRWIRICLKLGRYNSYGSYNCRREIRKGFRRILVWSMGLFLSLPYLLLHYKIVFFFLGRIHKKLRVINSDSTELWHGIEKLSYETSCWFHHGLSTSTSSVNLEYMHFMTWYSIDSTQIFQFFFFYYQKSYFILFFTKCKGIASNAVSEVQKVAILFIFVLLVDLIIISFILL